MKTLTTLILIAMSIYSIAANIDTAFLEALAEVESNNNDAAVNTAEDAHGRYQIRQAYLTDANHLLGTCYTLQDMHDPTIAERVVRAYLLAYGNLYERNTCYPASPLILARIHNGGPKGYDKAATYDYGMRVAQLRADKIVEGSASGLAPAASAAGKEETTK